jgi:transcriptional regulator with XRE-family HTH domain
MELSEIAKIIRSRRESLNLRQEDLAEMSGVATKTIHSVEAGSGNPSLETLLKLADILGLEIVVQVKKIN